MPVQDLPEVNISEELESEISLWLQDEFTRTSNARGKLQSEWEQIEKLYQQTELEEKKDYPFEGAAHLMIALMPTYCEQIKAKTLNTILAPNDPFTVFPRNKQFVDFVKPLRSFLSWAVKEELNLEETLDSMFIEWLKLGTMVAKVVYSYVEETRFEYEEATNEWIEVLDTVKDHPEIIHVPLEDYWFPLEARSQEEMEWEGHRFRLSKNALLQGEMAGKYKNVERLFGWEEAQLKDLEEVRHDQSSTLPEYVEEYELVEFWFRYYFNGALRRMCWIMHVPSGTVLRKLYNYNPMQFSPFVVQPYEPREHMIYGFGVGRMALPYQIEISTMHNQRLDQGSLANSGVFKRKADSIVPADLRVQLGGTIPVDDQEDLMPLVMGSQFNSTLQDEQHTLRLLQERIGMQDFMGPEMVAQAQATSMLAAMAESTRRFDLTIRRVRRFLAEVIMRVLLLYQKYYPEGKAMLVLGPDGQYVEIIQTFPENWIRDGLGVQVTATTSTTSKELERQNKLSLFGMVSQYYGQITQYLLQAQNQQYPEPVRMVLLRIVDGLSTLVEDILEDYNLSRASELAIFLQELREQTQQIGVPPSLPQAPGGPGMAALPGVSGAASQGEGQGPEGF